MSTITSAVVAGANDTGGTKLSCMSKKRSVPSMLTSCLLAHRFAASDAQRNGHTSLWSGVHASVQADENPINRLIGWIENLD
jgi:hypothetical protein